jgi:CHAD domain-containing protein
MPRAYVLDQLCLLDALWSGVRDGDIDAVHDARVATRRTRAALPFVFTIPPPAAGELRRMGRVLGRVRELDATNALLNRLEPRVSDAVSAIAIVRREVTRRLDRERRRMIKRLRHDPRSIARVILKGGQGMRLTSLWRNWRHELREAVHHQAADVQSALDRATAVFMPNRAHAARITVKKLRYTVEVALATGVMTDVHALEDLKRVQETLGDLHDMTVVAKLIDDTAFPGDLSAESLAFAEVVRAEATRLHQKYVRRRDEIRAACDACVRDVAPRNETPLAIRVAAVAIPVIAWYLQPRHTEQQRLA